MRSLMFLVAMAATGLAQTAQFTNTSFAGPFMVGQTVPLMWTEGNGLPISVSIANATWNYKVFDNRAVLPTNYSWVIAPLPGFASGTYQLSLTQLNRVVNTSPAFGVIVPDDTNATSTAPAAAATVTYIYFDVECGCTKTESANTVAPVTMTQWWDDECGCHTTAMVPITTLAPAANNYTVPTAPPPMTTPSVQTPGSQPSTTRASPSAAFTGGAGRTKRSVLGIVGFLAAVVAM